ncbi:hypothetical protein IAT40_004211 [Kwoniella sp. CBS 6097]
MITHHSKPHLINTPNGGHHLIVDGKPSLILAGELQNSSFSSASFMDPLRHGMRLVLLWFGSWKNGMSTYAPAWVKRDHKRFERASVPGDDGRGQIVEFLTSRNLSCQTEGSWSDVFGPSAHADEVFMAYHYAVYVERVALAGKATYDLPMFTNAWLSSIDKDDTIQIPVMAGGGKDPGTRPSGGPNIEVLDMVLTAWTHRPQPLFIPEQRRDPPGLRRMWDAFGTYGALTASPFGVDSLEDSGRYALREHFGLLQQLEYYILQSQAHPGSCYGFYFDEPKPGETVNDTIKTIRLGTWDLSIKRAFVPGQLDAAYGAIFPLETDRFLVAGAGYQIFFKSTDALSIFTGLTHFDEKEVTNARAGTLRTVRRFNGDETLGGKSVVMPSLKPDADSFPIAIFIPAGTRIAEVELYHLTES